MAKGIRDRDSKPVADRIRSMKLTKTIISIITIVVGLVLIIWSRQSLNIICSIVGWILCAAGVVAVVLYFVNYKDRSVITYLTLVMGVFVAVIGLWLAINPQVLETLLPSIFGLIIVISGIMNISESMTVRRQNGSFAASLLLAAITIVLGLVIFFHPQAFNDFIMIFIGIGLLYDGVSNLVIMSMISTKAKEVVQDVTAIDGAAREVSREKEKTPEKEKAPEREKTPEKEKTPDKEPEKAAEPAPSEEETEKDQMD
ncbi:MAG TPA: hypothetical protein DGX96_12655 [Lachnospiraceae bacterium]|jgi:uncharacterized membrane protein HdeD (DUF308 family)|nr:hypothetical protein [Lachnospiraceae bacterium]